MPFCFEKGVGYGPEQRIGGGDLTDVGIPASGCMGVPIDGDGVDTTEVIPIRDFPLRWFVALVLRWDVGLLELLQFGILCGGCPYATVSWRWGLVGRRVVSLNASERRSTSRAPPLHPSANAPDHRLTPLHVHPLALCLGAFWLFVCSVILNPLWL